jgi:mannose/fructose-specific phosphotransferase system component IIA
VSQVVLRGFTNEHGALVQCDIWGGTEKTEMVSKRRRGKVSLSSRVA